MDSIRLKISTKDWLYIVLVGASFGFLLSLFFYLLNSYASHYSTIVFGTLSALNISVFSFVLISISNEFILPNLSEKFWTVLSFLFSFASGFLGFSTSFFIGKFFEIGIVDYLYDYWLFISTIIGLLTFLIGLILHQFVSMKHRNEYVQKEILETKIKSLENELNPHFLFNALNSISELIYIDKQKAEKATLDLSQFLRNAITKDSLISVEHEIEMVKTYLDIENIRFDSNIKLKVEMDEEMQNILVPKFSIQLLVENAIKHGYNQKVLDVNIIVNKESIIVSNNGKISENLNFGTGLNNLSRRLVLLNIGSLSYKVKDSKMCFSIDLKKGK